ncbi:MAG: class I SAM-dependent methyltransferase [Elusimicrobiota bacterium]
MERPLTPEERTSIRALYNDRYAEKGRSHETVGWSSRKDQRLRFEMLFRGLPIHGKTLLDVGCGLGDLIPFLDEKTGKDYEYLGTDISESLIADAEKTFGGPHRRFLVADILEQELPKADIVVLSGALNFRIADNMSHARSMLRKMFELSNETAAANFLSSFVDFQHPKNFHYPPGELFDFSKTLTRWVSLHHDYPLWEFTLQLHRRALEAS